MTAVLRRLDSVCSITMGQAPLGDSYNDHARGLPLIAGAGDFNGERPQVKKFTTAPLKVCGAGDIVLGIRASIGAKVWADREYCLGRGVAGLRPSSDLHDRYLWHWLTSSSRKLTAKGRGATFLQVSRVDIGEMQIPIPSLDEQRRIADILDQADALRAKRLQVLAHLDALTQSIFVDMFGDVPATTTVEEMAARTSGAIRTGPFGSQLLHGEFVGGGVAVLGLDNVVGNEFRWVGRRFITQEKFKQLRRYTVRPGDVLISIMGTVGRCVVVPNDIPQAINTKHICAVTPDRERLDSNFLRATFLWHPESRGYLRRQTKGSIMDGLNMGVIKRMPIPLIDLQDQRLFAARASAIENLRSAVRRHDGVLESLFASLVARAFRGNL